MSTQCGIAIKTEKGYETIYVHSDGGPSYMLPMLTENYNSEELATKLIGFGDASCIDKRLEPTPGSNHRFGCREEDVCIFYGRDRGEKDTGPNCYDKRLVFNMYYYAYIWEDGCWHFYKDGKEVHQ